MGDTWKHVSFHTSAVLMSISLPSSSSPSSSSSPPQQHLCRCGPALPVTGGYRTRPSVLRCVQLLRSPGLQFRAPLCFPVVFLFSVPHSWAPLPKSCISFCLVGSPEDCRELGTGHTGVLSSICIIPAYLLNGFPLSFLKKWGHLNSNAGECCFSKILFVSKSDFKMKCEWVIRCQGI